MKYFEMMMDAYYEPGGVIYAPQGTPYPLARDVQKVIGYENLKFELRDGAYLHYRAVNAGANIVSKELKDLIMEYIPKDYPLEFLPITVHSDVYGNRQYFIMHFKVIFDVINKGKTIYAIPDDETSVIKLCLDCKKVEYINIFNSQPNINDVIVSDKLRKAIKTKGCDEGIHFQQINCE
jgi:hypothetical protein